MSAQDDLAAAVNALGAEKTERDSKVTAVRDALNALHTAVDALDGAAPVADAAPESVPADPVDVSPQPAIDPMTGQPAV